ncbi:hypothetical protein LXL04_038715 [Taraxacum kok-saghyz]
MEKTEPTFVPEWLKSSGGLGTSHQSSSLHPDEQGVSKTVRNKSLDTNTTTSSYFRRSSISNGSALSRSYSSFNRNNRDNNRDWQKDYSDPLPGTIAPSRFEKEGGLRRSFSSVPGKQRADSSSSSWPRKVASDLSIANKSSSNVKTSFERDFPSLEKQADNNNNNNNNDIGRVPSPGLSSAIQSLPIGNPAVIGGDGWTSALAEVPVIVATNGGVHVQPSSSSVSANTGVTGGRNMAETLAHGPPRTQTAPQVNVGTQRLEELAVKQSRQLIPMTPSMPKALADKPKLKVGQSNLVNHHPQSPRPVSIKPADVSKTSKLLVLKPSRGERNNGTTKETLSPTAGTTKLPNSPLASSPSVIPSKNNIVEKRPSSQAQSRSNFFNLMRKKSMSAAPSGEKSAVTAAAAAPALLESTVVKEACSNGKSHGDVILYSEEEEARFLRSLGWDETAEEEEGLTEEEISSFYRNYMSLKGTEAKLLVGSESKVDA